MPYDDIVEAALRSSLRGVDSVEPRETRPNKAGYKALTLIEFTERPSIGVQEKTYSKGKDHGRTHETDRSLGLGEGP